MPIFIKSSLSIAIILTFLNAVSAQKQTAIEIIQNYFDTVSNGNIKNWDTINSVVVESVNYYSQQEFDGLTPNLFNASEAGYHRTYREWPDKLRSEVYGDSAFTRLESFMLWLPDKVIMQFGNLSPTVNPRTEPFGWEFNPVLLSKSLKKNNAIRYHGIKHFETDGISCHEIELRIKESTVFYYFNTTTYMLEYSSVSSPADSKNHVRYLNYKCIDGLLFNMGSYAMKNGRIFHSTKTLTITINPSIDPEKFKWEN